MCSDVPRLLMIINSVKHSSKALRLLMRLSFSGLLGLRIFLSNCVNISVNNKELAKRPYNIIAKTRVLNFVEPFKS